MAQFTRALDEKSLPYVFVHRWQYDDNMSQQFIEELELPKPNHGFMVRLTRLDCR